MDPNLRANRNPKERVRVHSGEANWHKISPCSPVPWLWNHYISRAHCTARYVDSSWTNPDDQQLDDNGYRESFDLACDEKEIWSLQHSWSWPSNPAMMLYSYLDESSMACDVRKYVGGYAFQICSCVHCNMTLCCCKVSSRTFRHHDLLCSGSCPCVLLV